MKNKKFIIHIISIIALFLALFQLTSCNLIEGIKGILEGFQFGEPESTEIVSTTENVPTDSSDTSDSKEADAYSKTIADADSQDEKSYLVTSTDKKGMKNKIETEHYVFYFNNINEEFLNIYIKIAEDGNKGLKLIFGRDLNSKIEIFLCEEFEEFKTASDGILPPDFDGSEPIGQSVNGVVHVFKPEEFKPGPGNIDEVLSYKIALLHEIGHAYYFIVYPNAAKKNDWLNEALADKSITGGDVNLSSISNGFLKDLIANGGFIALSELESRGKRTFNQDEYSVFAEYISFINFIALKFGFNTLNLLLEEYNNSKDLLTSLETATKLNFSSFEEQWLNAI
ncbi:MAG: hypothetical protein MUO96_04915 [Actinobacteria bacterium]|nr:hypothetical protein [Actinomycetota bacterium]